VKAKGKKFAVVPALSVLAVGFLVLALEFLTDVPIDSSLSLAFSLLLAISSFLLWQVNKSICQVNTSMWEWSKDRAEDEDRPELVPVGVARIERLSNDLNMKIESSILNPGRFPAALEGIAFLNTEIADCKRAQTFWKSLEPEIRRSPGSGASLVDKFPGVIFAGGMTHLEVRFTAESERQMKEALKLEKLIFKLRYRMGNNPTVDSRPFTVPTNGFPVDQRTLGELPPP